MKNRALISVYDKTQLIPFAQKLIALNYEIISSGGTFTFLQKANIPVLKIESITQFPEVLSGRVKTLHPLIYAGILADRTNKEHMEELQSHQIVPIGLVVVNVYPFEKKIKENIPEAQMREWIDIGGPSLLRAAAKNGLQVMAVCQPEDYQKVIENIEKKDLNFNQFLIAKVFKKLAQYNQSIGNYYDSDSSQTLNINYQLNKAMRYGENPHQKAEFYLQAQQNGIWSGYQQLQGKALSYNNIRDINITWKIISEFDDEYVAVATKHSTPCGMAIGQSNAQAFEKVLLCDNQSIFGGVLAFNKMITEKEAHMMRAIFLEVIIAPAFSPKALKILQSKKNLRLITFQHKKQDRETIYPLDGGLLKQEQNLSLYKSLNCVTTLKPSKQQLNQGIQGLKVVKYAKSNAIVVLENEMTTGIDGGQVNRFFAAKNALQRANGKTEILVSDGFFPFDDIAKLAKKHGVKCIFQPGGSIKDQVVIDTCNQLGLIMIFTGLRLFFH